MIGVDVFIVSECMSMDFMSKRVLSKISAIDTSYEMVCATPRSDPRSAYFELADHPEMNVAYTFILDTHMK